jgi:hypothetical protein
MVHWPRSRCGPILLIEKGENYRRHYFGNFMSKKHLKKETKMEITFQLVITIVGALIFMVFCWQTFSKAGYAQ